MYKLSEGTLYIRRYLVRGLTCGYNTARNTSGELDISLHFLFIKAAMCIDI